MVVKIENPEPDPSVVKRVVCRECGVTLSYVPKDVIRTDYKDYTGSSDTLYEIRCPACKSRVRLWY